MLIAPADTLCSRKRDPVVASDSRSSDDLAPAFGIESIWKETRGDARICVAVLDGPVDITTASLRGANLQQLEGLVPSRPDDSPATQHGTHIGNIIFAQGNSPSAGIAPACRGVAIPIFESPDGASIRACSQLDLARALTRARLAGAHVINVSGGQFSPAGAAHPLLADVVRDCARHGVLIVAAAGNDGCECLHVPAALDAVLAVGAMDPRGEPLAYSNWGSAYRDRGILAPVGATASGVFGGTSYATAIVSGVVALLLSLQLRRGERPDPYRVRDALLAAAASKRRNHTRGDDARYLTGPLDVRGTVSFLTHQGKHTMAEPNEVQASDLPQNRVFGGANVSPPPAAREAGERPGSTLAEPAESARPRAESAPEEKPATCGCGAKAGPPSVAYALGQISYDFRTEARLDSFAQKMAAEAGIRIPDRSLAYDPRRFLAHLDKEPWDAAAVEWTLNLHGTALYAIRPVGAFAADGYQLLRRFLKEQLEEGVERISVPGLVAGKATLLNGQTVPAIIPEMRGMYSWTTGALVDAVVGKVAHDVPEAERNGFHERRQGVRNFLSRLYHEVRNLGLSPQHRALNYAATNAFAAGEIYAAAIREKMELDRVDVVPSPVGRPGSDCWDVEVYFFYPERQVQTVRKVYRFTVDVSDTVPVTVGEMQSWYTR